VSHRPPASAREPNACAGPRDDPVRRVAVVTGASSGIGRRVAEDLSRRGWRVCAAARREGHLRSLIEGLGGEEAGHCYVVTDVSDSDDVARLAAEVDTRYGRCDALVNNAGFSARRRLDAPDALEVTEAILATNYRGAVACTRALLPALRAAAPASVVNVASVAGRVPVAGNAAYVASKFALVGWSESIRAELARDGITVSLVEPGPVPTEGFPQRAMTTHPVGRHVIAGVEDVSREVLRAIAGGDLQRTVPRVYGLLPLLRLLAPRVWDRIAVRILAARDEREGLEPTCSD
jgi:uncharacterized protein